MHRYDHGVLKITGDNRHHLEDRVDSIFHIPIDTYHEWNIAMPRAKLQSPASDRHMLCN